jgi:hypothetical protein
MTFDEVTAERRRLFNMGGLALFTLPSGRGRMQALDPTDWAAQGRANRYNELAAEHERMARRETWSPTMDSRVRPHHRWGP